MLKNGKTAQQVSLTSINDKDDVLTPLDSLKNISKIIDSIQTQAIDSITTKTLKKTKRNKNKITIVKGSRLDKFIKYQREYPEETIENALDSLKIEQTFFNKFLYNRAQLANSFLDKKESRDLFFSQLLSYGSVALFVFLPFFTIFLKLLYIRRKYTYVDHLIFVFHTQTVFFMLLTIYYLIKLTGVEPKLLIFIALFLIYLFIAMKKFYQQNIFKTILKFIILNYLYLFIASIGVFIVAMISFALY